MVVDSPTRTHRSRTAPASSSTCPTPCSSSISQFLRTQWLRWSAGPVVTIAQRMIFRAGPVYAYRLDLW